MRQLSRPALAVLTAAVAALLLLVMLDSVPPAAAAGDADVKAVSLTWGTPDGSNKCVNPAPAEIPVNTNVTLCTRLTFHNNGPMDPADVSINRSAQFVPQGTQPANECTITPTSGLLTFNNVPASVTLTRDELYTVNCTKPSFHKFRVTNDLSPGPAGTTDPVPGNNSATADLDVGVTAEADFSIVSQELRDADCIAPAPTTILVNTDAVFCLVKTVHNDGPYGPTAADIFFRSDAPDDCTLVPFVDSNGAQLHVSVNFTLTELFTLNCAEPSNHTFLVENFMEPTDPHVTDPDGVSYMATSHTVAVLAQTDIKVQSQSPSAPSSAEPGVPFTVQIDKTVHNNGPFGPVTADVTATVSAPADCTVVPDPANPASVNLPSSVATPLTESFEITCSDPSFHEITIQNCLSIDVLHLEDPTPGNNCADSTVNVPIQIKADLKIQSQSVTAPAEAEAGVAFDISVVKSVHNNGPAPSAAANVASAISAPPDCAVTPDPGNTGAITLSSSVATPLTESFSVVCTGTSFHDFTIENCIEPANIHVVDEDPSNNCQTDNVTVAITGESDAKIVFQEVIDPPPAPVDLVAIDMDPDNTPANTATSVGSIEDCGEVATGGQLTINVVVKNIPAYSAPNGGIIGFSFDFLFDGSKVRVVGRNAFLLLAANGGTIPLDFSDTTPDADGNHLVAAADFGSTTPESGDGILVSLVLEGLSSGTSPLTLTNVFLADGNNEGYSINAIENAEVRVDGTCPAPATPTPSPSPSPSPTPTPSPGVPPDLIFDVGEEFGIKLNKTMHNNGPSGPVDVAINTSFSAPPDCTVLASPLNATSATLPVSSSVGITETFLTSCSSPSEHVFTFTNCLETVDVHVTDPDLNNNCWTSDLTIVVLSTTDLKISSQTLTAPNEAAVGDTFDLIVDKTVHNNGPDDPGQANVNVNVSAPADCTVTPAAGNPSSLSLAASVSQNITEQFSVTCSEPSFHEFQITNCLETVDIHQSDPEPGNNCQTSTATVAITAVADLKVTAQAFHAADCASPPPDILPPDTDLDFCLVTTVHNNGPFGPVDADVEYTVTPPAGCTATPSNLTVPVNGMQVSVAQTISQVFTLNCNIGGVHNFQFVTAIAPENIHLEDPQEPNNIQTGVLEVMGEEADPKITSVVVDCPEDAQTGQPFDCDVDVTVHNNGPSSPVPVDVETTLVPPFDCVLNPSGSQTQPAVLVVSTSQVLTYTWQVTCSDYSFHTFVANSELEISDPGILELDPNNNSGSGQDTTTVSALVDVKVPTVAGIAPASVPANTPFDVQVDVSIHNNGPVSPVAIEGGAGIAVPNDCTIQPHNYQLFNDIPMTASSTQVISRTFTVTCTDNGDHQIVVCGRAGPMTLHVIEESTHSNFKSAPIIVNIGGNSPILVPTKGCSVEGDPPEICGDGIDNDGDTLIDEGPDTDGDGINDCDDPDIDGDGFSNEVEEWVGTDPYNACARAPFDSAWPPDFNNDRSITITDVLAIKPFFNTLSGGPGYLARYDLDASGAITISDVLRIKAYFGETCS